jgi:hypothetical protein
METKGEDVEEEEVINLIHQVVFLNIYFFIYFISFFVSVDIEKMYFFGLLMLLDVLNDLYNNEWVD